MNKTTNEISVIQNKPNYVLEKITIQELKENKIPKEIEIKVDTLTHNNQPILVSEKVSF